MGISDPLARTPEFHAFASQFGLSDAQAASAADALLPAMLDANGDGNPLDDILRMAGKSVR